MGVLWVICFLLPLAASRRWTKGQLLAGEQHPSTAAPPAFFSRAEQKTSARHAAFAPITHPRPALTKADSPHAPSARPEPDQSRRSHRKRHTRIRRARRLPTRARRRT